MFSRRRRRYGRVVKATDLKSVVRRTRGFEPHWRRFRLGFRRDNASCYALTSPSSTASTSNSGATSGPQDLLDERRYVMAVLAHTNKAGDGRAILSLEATHNGKYILTANV